MDNQKIQKVKIFLALLIAFFLTQFLAGHFFFLNSPRINSTYLKSLFAKKPTPTQIPTPFPTPTSTEIFHPTIILQPTKAITNYPSQIPTQTVEAETPTPTPTIIYYNNPTFTPFPTATRIPTPAPTRLVACPTNSNRSYGSLSVDTNDPNKLSTQPQYSPDVNLYLRGFTPVNQNPMLISRNGNPYGLDDRMPPQISSLYGGPIPQISKTYQIYEWDFQHNKSLAPQVATPNMPVHMLGLAANPGQPLYGLRAGRTIDATGDVFLVLYATKNYVLFTHSGSDNLFDGYLFYFLDICVDPNLLGLYNQDNAGGRRQLPVISTGQVFGYAASSEVKIVVRDTLSFMDTRVKEDWWFWGQ